MTASTSDSTLYHELVESGQFSGLTAVTLSSVEPVQILVSPAGPAPFGSMPLPSNGPHGGFTYLTILMFFMYQTSFVGGNILIIYGPELKP